MVSHLKSSQLSAKFVFSIDPLKSCRTVAASVRPMMPVGRRPSFCLVKLARLAWATVFGVMMYFCSVFPQEPWGLSLATSTAVFSFHTGLVLTPAAQFTDLTDCSLNAARLVFSTCPSRFATPAAQFSSNSNYSSARYARAPPLALIRADAGVY